MDRFSETGVLKILFFATSCDRGGGSFHSLFDLALQLKAQGRIDPYVVLPGRGSAEEMLRSSGIQFRVFKSYGSEWPIHGSKSLRSRLSHFKQRVENLTAINGILDWTRNVGIDIVHINTSLNEVGYYVARWLHVPFVWHIREFVNEGLGLEFYNEKKVLRHMRKASAIITVSAALQRKYTSLLPGTKILVIPNGIDEQRFFYPRTFSLKRKAFRIASIGRISRLKGHFDLVEAFRMLKKRVSFPVELFFAGPYGEELECLVNSYGLSDCVHFLGVLESPEALLRKIDVYVSGHPWEGFGRASVEAMMAGCCLVGVNNAGTHELLQDGKYGYCFEPGNPESLCDILENALTNFENTIRLAEAGRAFAKTAFSLRNTSESVWKLYMDTVNKK